MEARRHKSIQADDDDLLPQIRQQLAAPALVVNRCADNLLFYKRLRKLGRLAVIMHKLSQPEFSVNERKTSNICKS